MILTDVELKELVLSKEPEWITEVKETTRKLAVHVNGDGTQEYLKQINDYENDDQFTLRKKLATSNKSITSNLLRPVDKVFSAKGGSRLLNLNQTNKNKKLTEALSNVRHGLNIRKWIQNIQANKYYSDPAGIVFFEWDKNTTYPTIKTIHCIKDYKSNGRKLDYVVFMPVERKNPDGSIKVGKYVRVVDDAKDYMIYVKEKDITILEDETYKNPFGQVPAIINSDIVNYKLKYTESPIENEVGILDHYLRTTSVKNIYEFLHGYPRYWEYVPECVLCEGSGKVDGATCPICKGHGRSMKKDVSDMLAIKPPESSEEPTIAPNVAGYIQPDLNTWQEQRTELDWLTKLTYYSHWGTVTNEKEGNETATGRFIDAQPVNDRLNKYSDAFEDMEKKMIDLIGIFLFTKYDGCSVNYGRRFLVEPPDVVWERYSKARTAGANKVTLNYLLIQFYQSEYQNDVEQLAISTKSILLEPFIHLTDLQVKTLGIQGEDYTAKIYFNEWFKTIPNAELLSKEVAVLETEFNTYLKTKENAGQETSGVQSNAPPKD